MRIAILALVVICALCGHNMRHKKSTVGEVHDLSNNVGVISQSEVQVSPPLTKQQFQINKAAKQTTQAIEQALKHSTETTLLEVEQSFNDDVIDNIPQFEETIDQMSSVKPEDVYSNDGNSPDMGKTAENFNGSEAPMASEDNQTTPQEEYYATETLITNEDVSLIQLGEIDALADIDTSMPLFDEDFKIDEQALQETPLNVGVDDIPEVQVDSAQNEEISADLERQTNEMTEALMNDQDIMINEVQLIQVADRGFY
ncbi:unnamed protein product (macronuclear) [Paramecium tetraurelia]|uniref:Uncharacterized protein n=1 Tax=Paramecium tetraurelia TaxID=5888 RepID=A0DZ68_PARTE|nr:uncharacterized protein GSPATT00003304001 [Paramecium tetraurelia]CAK88335.1 unnamed protein product [Paramecium tetraurelia]|eukprot:XP_001455732.1 hypothetical protein (macronuclear) [Paramecium tetraurelia strain d4-2]